MKTFFSIIGGTIMVLGFITMAGPTSINFISFPLLGMAAAVFIARSFFFKNQERN